jgi:hypothetical protein
MDVEGGDGAAGGIEGGIEGAFAKTLFAFSKGEMTLRGLGGEIGRPGAPAGTFGAVAKAAVAAARTTARWVAKIIVLAAHVCVSIFDENKEMTHV